MTIRIARHIRLLGATGVIRTATFQEKEHIVVPVIALVEGVIHSANSKEPEFVPSESFKMAPNGWDGRPVVGGHPVRDDHFVSANSPEVLEKEAFGTVFNAAIQNNKLIFDAYIDPQRAERSGPVGKRILERVRQGDILEVSVGAFVEIEETPGEHKGQRFAGIWRSITPDHLAILAEGDIGACSVEMGCGTMRSAMVNLITNDGIRILKTNAEVSVADPKTTIGEPTPQRTLRERVLDLLKFQNNATAAELSDSDIRSLLDKKLREIEPGYLGIDSVFQADNLVVYATAPKDSLILLRRSFTVGKDGALTLSDTSEEVQPVTRFEAVNAIGQPCGCHDKGVKVMDKAKRIQALIDSKRFAETDKTWLEAIPEDRLSTLEAAPVPAPAKVEDPKVEDPKKEEKVEEPKVSKAAEPQTTEQYLASAPAEVRETISEALGMVAAKKTGIIKALKATERCDYDEATLKALSVQDLERLLKLAGGETPVSSNVSFLGKNTAQPEADGGKISAPIGLVKTLQAQKAAKAS